MGRDAASRSASSAGRGMRVGRKRRAVQEIELTPFGHQRRSSSIRRNVSPAGPTDHNAAQRCGPAALEISRDFAGGSGWNRGGSVRGGCRAATSLRSIGGRLMQAQATSAAVCPECGTRLAGAFSRGLGRCMICLLRIGFDDGEEPDETLLAPVTDRLGNYRIQRRDDGAAWALGRGALGVTYRAVDTSLQRPVALKLIASEWVKRGAEARERFMREARTAAALRHPNVATVYHFGIREEKGQCFCAIELVEGETLETRVRRTGPLDALTTIEIALQVSSALAAAEKQGLVHRDLKPANLMLIEADSEADVRKSGRVEAPGIVVKVIDFGVAKALAEKPDVM